MTTRDAGRTPSLRLPSDGDISGRWFGEEELNLVREVLASGTLTSTRGTMVRRLEEAFAADYGATHCIAASSGSAAVHAALAALDLEPGAEVVTTPITDMGGLTPILYEDLVPVFADVEPGTGNLTARTIEAVLTPRTRAVILVHLFGHPCRMEPILDLLRPRGIRLIEDCAQAFFAEWAGRRVGTFGDLAAFSLQQGKHMTCGEGGLVLTSDAALARRARLFVNKAWPYGEPDPDHEFRALNYRLSELQGAVALGQFSKVHRVVESRQRTAAALTAALRDIPGLSPPEPPPAASHVYWRYLLRVDPAVAGDVRELGGRLQVDGVACVPRYIQKPAFECRLFRESPYRVERPRAAYPGSYEMLDRALVLPWNEAYTAEHVEFLASTIRGAVGA